MKTAKTLNTRSNKDNIASATILAVSLLFVAGGLFASPNADAAIKAIPKSVVQKMDAIVVTAPRMAPAAKLATMVITATRTTSQA
jgi:hypothetical protein